MHKIKQLLQKSGIPIKDFAEKIEVHTTTVSYWFNGRYIPSLKNARKIVDFFGGIISIEDIYNK